jgi:hypothetical protein
MTLSRECARCGAAFEPQREHARFCSARCRVAWNRDHVAGGRGGDSALDWSVIAMADTAERLGRLTVTDPPHAFAVISEAVWWVTIVDATLVRYHSAAYGQAMRAREPAARQVTEATFTGLRFVRNRMGYHTPPADFIRPADSTGHDAGPPVAAWTWRPLPPPGLETFPPGRGDWEMSRYHAYQAQLAEHPLGETFQRAAGFLAQAAQVAAGPVRSGSGRPPRRG